MASSVASSVTSIDVSGLPVEIVRKNIKHVHLSVNPPSGRVRVSAPLRIGDEAIRAFVASRLAWVRRQQQKFASQERQTAREYVSGESHFYLGRRYLLHVVYEAGPPRVAVRNNKLIEMVVRPGSDADYRERVMQAWYRAQLKALIPPLLDKWSTVLGVHADEWGVKQMKTRWGTCNIGAKRVWLNLELAKKPAACLEYVVVHELVHLLERLHNERFYALMTRALPDWRARREELNRAPIGHPAWEY